MSKGFFDDDPPSLGTIRLRQLLHNGFKQSRRDRQVVRWICLLYTSPNQVYRKILQPEIVSDYLNIRRLSPF